MYVTWTLCKMDKKNTPISKITLLSVFGAPLTIFFVCFVHLYVFYATYPVQGHGGLEAIPACERQMSPCLHAGCHSHLRNTTYRQKNTSKAMGYLDFPIRLTSMKS